MPFPRGCLEMGIQKSWRTNTNVPGIEVSRPDGLIDAGKT